MSDQPNQFGAAESLRDGETSPASPTAVKRFLSDGTTDSVTSGGVTSLADGGTRAVAPGGDLPLSSAGDDNGIRPQVVDRAWWLDHQTGLP